MDAPGDFADLGELSRRILSRMDRLACLLRGSASTTYTRSPPLVDYFRLLHRSLRLESEWIRRAVHASEVQAQPANCESSGMAASIALGIALRLRYSALPRRHCAALFLEKSAAFPLDIVRGIRRRLADSFQKYSIDRLPGADADRDLFSVSRPVPEVPGGGAARCRSGNRNRCPSFIVGSLWRRHVDHSLGSSRLPAHKSSHRTAVQHLRTRRISNLASLAAGQGVYRWACFERVAL